MRFLYLKSDTMGNGEAELGRKLLIKFLEELLKTGELPEMIGCVNSGVFLTTREGEALEHLKEFERRGVKISSCGTCLDHYGIRDELKIGAAGTMAQAVEAFNMADKIISPC